MANYDDNDVSAYKINATSGALAPVGRLFGAGSGPYTVTVYRTGKFAYTINLGSGDIFRLYDRRDQRRADGGGRVTVFCRRVSRGPGSRS